MNYLDLDAILNEAAKIDFTPLAAVLRDGRSKDDVYSVMRPFSSNLGPMVQRLLAGKINAIGVPESTNVSTILLIAAFDRYPGIRNDLTAFFARPDVQADVDQRYAEDHVSYPSSAFVPFCKPSAAKAKVQLVRQIGDGTPPPVFAQALVRAVKAARAVMDNLVEEYVEKLVIVDGFQDVSEDTREDLKAIISRQSRSGQPFVDPRRTQRIAADPFVLRVGVHFQQKEHQDHPLRASVASTLF